MHHLLADLAAVLTPAEPPGGETGDEGGSTGFLANAPNWLKTIYVIVGSGGGAGVLALVVRLIWPSRHTRERSEGNATAKTESNTERIDRYLDKAETDLEAARAVNDKLEQQVLSLTLQLQEVREALARSREAEAGARATIATLTDFLRELRDQPGGGQQ